MHPRFRGLVPGRRPRRRAPSPRPRPLAVRRFKPPDPPASCCHSSVPSPASIALGHGTHAVHTLCALALGLVPRCVFWKPHRQSPLSSQHATPLDGLSAACQYLSITRLPLASRRGYRANASDASQPRRRSTVILNELLLLKFKLHKMAGETLLSSLYNGMALTSYPKPLTVLQESPISPRHICAFVGTSVGRPRCHCPSALLLARLSSRLCHIHFP
jgi:hypothetical protein